MQGGFPHRHELMNAGILSIPSDIPRVNARTYQWFTKCAADDGCKRIEFSNGIGHFVDNTLVAAEIFGQPDNLHYVRVRK
jgi:hypothetical protein